MQGDKVLVGLISLGCAKNQVDSEYMLAGLERAGFGITDDLSLAQAVVVNTCGFIRAAKEESIETILEAAKLKESGQLKVLAVVGCLAERYGSELVRELPEVDVFLGVGPAQRSLGERISLALGLTPSAAPCAGPVQPRLVETVSRGWAYLKIAEGCNNRCAYCAIPLIRGSLASRPVEDLTAEARFLEGLGALELNLIAQDVTAYGMDRGSGSPGLTGLLGCLLEETSLPWIRLLYAHPAHLDRGLLEFMAAHPRILPYLDLPIQHASDRVLERMGRGVTRSRIRQVIDEAREVLGRPVLRTTVLVGFPGETKRDFAELLEFIEEVRFDRLGGFIYSAEEGTRAFAERDRVPRAEKERRLEAVIELQRTISAECQAERVGQTVPVLVEQALGRDERPSPEYRWVGRSPAHAPEVDGWVYLSGKSLSPGRIVRARITDSGDYDLFGEPE
jgi:ribosomal protein S12 methylthiotransferase